MIWYLFLACFLTRISCQTDVKIVSKTRTTFLDKYQGYSDVVLIHLQVPRDSLFASFKFAADENSMSIFGCSPRKVSLYMKHNAAPVINPDGSQFPKSSKKIHRETLYNIEFQSDEKPQYINLTSPAPGSYYVATFLSYTDPKEHAIQPPGLTPICLASVDAILLANTPTLEIQLVVENTNYDVSSPSNTKIYYKFYAPSSVDRSVLILDQIKFPEGDGSFVARVQFNGLPSDGDTTTSYIKSKTVYAKSSQTEVSLGFNVEEGHWYYVEFLFDSTEDVNVDNNTPQDSNATFRFRLKHIRFEQPDISEAGSEECEDAAYYSTYGTALQKILRTDDITQVTPYKQYDLLRMSTTESVSFSFELRKAVQLNVVVPVNVTSTEFAAFRFVLRDSTDIGGALQFILAYKPRVKRTGGGGKVLEKEPENHTVIGCIRQNAPEIPTWPDKCILPDSGTPLLDRVAPVLLNASVDNSSVQIPFPESGVWYATFKLFCDKECVPCRCPNECQQEYAACARSCEATCTDERACRNCAVECRNGVIAKEECKECDCDGPCVRSKKTCNSSVMFDVSSYPCVAGGCGKNGRCTFMVSDGVVYSTCICTNNYRGWDCRDDSQANPYWQVVLELLLLVLSNLGFLPAVYVAYKRQYYVEAAVYLSICFFSTFYHACDAGENIISFCIARLAALQFGDFFCALLSIWVTLIAMANLPGIWPNLLQVVGAIVLGFTISISKTSVWAFAVPALSGLVIVGVSWYLKHRKIKQMFLNKRYAYVYLPIGGVLVVVGLLIFGLLQTNNNYKYVHSLWHLLMAGAVILILPRSDTFQPETRL